MNSTVDHPLKGMTIHECILDAAEEVLSKAAGGLVLPGFTTTVESEDESDGSSVIRVSYDTTFAGEVVWDVEHDFLLDENVLKGLAQGRKQDIADFMVAFLPTYRSLVMGSYIDYLVGISSHRAGMDGTSIDHKWLADDVKWFQSYIGPWTTPWELVAASANSASEDWFELKLRFENSEIPETYRSNIDEAADYDGREITFPISWEDYLGARGSEKGMHALLKRLHGAFVVTGDLASGYYSRQADQLLKCLDNDDEGDCPFANGELVIDGDGRVHSASDVD